MAEQEVRLDLKKVRMLYSLLFIPLMRLLFLLVTLFNSKARRGFFGRRKLFAALESKLPGMPEGNRIWFHASSLGEFEQAKPIIDILKRSGFRIIVSFFSPSGYEHSLNYPNADVITYIPLDTRKNAERFVKLVKPNVAVVMRYDLWMNHLIAAKEFGAKVIIADATFPIRLFQRAKFVRSFFGHVYGQADLILATSSENKKMFDFFLKKDITIAAGDTRFDRVYGRSVSNNVAERVHIKIDRSKRTVLVLGSTWPQDLEIIGDGIMRLSKEFPSLSVIIVPHEPTEDEVRRLVGQFPGAKVLSEVERSGDDWEPFLIVDRVGILTQLYVLSDIAYVGGGFGTGVHSVLEPAVYGVPIITGPRIERSDEAMQLMQDGALFFVKNQSDAYFRMRTLVENREEREKAGNIARKYVNRNIGASIKVAEAVMSFCGD